MARIGLDTFLNGKEGEGWLSSRFKLFPLETTGGADYSLTSELPDIAAQIEPKIDQKGQQIDLFEINNTSGNAEATLFFGWWGTLLDTQGILISRIVFQRRIFFKSPHPFSEWMLRFVEIWEVYDREQMRP